MTLAIADAIASVPLAALDDLGREVWRLHGAGQLDDDQAQALAEAIHARKAARTAARAERAGPVPLGRLTSIFPPKPRQRPRDRSQSVERRRTVAASSPLPPAMAARYTVGELATLGIVADELAAKGRCVLTIAEIAARAGVSHRLAQGALRLAERLGLLVIEARPQKGRKHLPNLIRCLCREWAAWLAKRRPPGCRNPRPTGKEGFSSSEKGPVGIEAKGFRGGKRTSRTEPGGRAPDSGGRQPWQKSSHGCGA